MAEEGEGGHRHSVLASLLLSLEMPFAPITYRVDNCHLLSRQIMIERSSHIGPGSPLFGKALTGRVEILAGWLVGRSAPPKPPPQKFKTQTPGSPGHIPKAKAGGPTRLPEWPNLWTSSWPAATPESRPRSKISPSIPLRVICTLRGPAPAPSPTHARITSFLALAAASTLPLSAP